MEIVAHKARYSISTSYWSILAGLRFFLAWIVFCNHIIVVFPSVKDIWIIRWCAQLNSFSAVIVFLVISGFSIANSIAVNEPKQFYKRRLLRIYPLYLFTILLSVLPLLIVESRIVQIGQNTFSQPSLLTVVGNVFFLQTYLVRVIDANPVLWTLGIECLCYLLAPIFHKLSSKSLFYIMGLSSLILSLYTLRPFLPMLFNRPPWAAGVRPDLANLLYGQPFLLFLWAWLLGFLYYRFYDNNRYKLLLVLLGCLLFTIHQVDNLQQAVMTYAVATSIIVLSTQVKLPNFAIKIFNYLGDISYPLYLIHFPLFVWCYSILRIESTFYIGIIVLLASACCYHFIDVPIRRRYKNRSMVTAIQ